MKELIRKFVYKCAIFVDGIIIPDVKVAKEILQSGDKATINELSKMRDIAFKEIINNSYENVPYYQDKFNQYLIKPENIKNINDINNLPILKKEDIRCAGEKIRSKNIDEFDYVISRSGGTSGEPISSYVNRKARALSTYSALRGFIWMGWIPGMKMINLFGGSLGRTATKNIRSILRDFVRGSIFLPAFELNKENTKSYMDTISKNGPCILNGYASAVYNLALYAEKIGYETTAIKTVFTTAEYLPSQWADKIRKVFSCQVKSYYGCGEINSLGFQVEENGPYWVPDEHVIIESVDKKDYPEIEHDNTLLVTSLYNYAQPLIRYQLGDIGEISPPGVDHPTRTCIKNLLGRTADMFTREDGTHVSSAIAPHIVFITKLPVSRYQFVQDKVTEINFLYETEVDDLKETQLNDIENILRKHISKEIQVNFIRTNEFLLSPEGKFRIVISKVKDEIGNS